MAKPEEYSEKLIKLPKRVAIIVGKTFVARGDDATLSDDEALMKIRDLIDEIDENLIAQNINKKLS